MWLQVSNVLLFCLAFPASFADNNLLSGANDIVAVRDQATGDLEATPFSVQYGKKDIWLPRAGHKVDIVVNGRNSGLKMTLDKNGRGYFPVGNVDTGRQYRFWSALFGTADPAPEQKTTSATAAQLDLLALKPGKNDVTFKVTSSGSVHTINNNIYLFNDTQKIVVSDIDGTITKSDVKGFIFPALGLSDWKHTGVVSLYNILAERGYQLLYLSARPIGQSSTTHSYLTSIQEEGKKMPAGPILLHVGSVLDALAEEVILGTPEISKISKLNHVRNVFSSSPFYSAYGNKDTDILAYKALNINPNHIYKIDQQSQITSDGTGISTNFTEHINNIESLYPLYSK